MGAVNSCFRSCVWDTTNCSESQTCPVLHSVYHTITTHSLLDINAEKRIHDRLRSTQLGIQTLNIKLRLRIFIPRAYPTYSVRFLPNQRPPSSNFQYRGRNYRNNRFSPRNRPHINMPNSTQHSDTVN